MAATPAASAVPVPPPPPAELQAAMSGVWKLDAAASESMEPLLAFMGVPWVARKLMANAPPPVLTLLLTPAGLDITQHNAFGKTRNELTWGSGNTYSSPGGKFLAALALEGASGAETPAPTCVVLAVDMPKGRITTTYAVHAAGAAGGTRTLVVVISNGAGVRVRRVFVEGG